MATIQLLQPDRIVLEDAIAAGAIVEVTDGRITDLRFTPDPAARRLAGTLLPGFVDLQVNGAGGYAVDEATPTALDEIAETVGQHGAAAFLPTLITAPFDRLLEQIRAVADWLEGREHREGQPTAVGAHPLGIHVEGPFLTTPGAHDASALVDPTPARVQALIEAGRGTIQLVTPRAVTPGRGACGRDAARG